jgi:CRISPR/Cas system-associated endonuclease Cas1
METRFWKKIYAHNIWLNSIIGQEELLIKSNQNMYRTYDINKIGLIALEPRCNVTTADIEILGELGLLH